MAGGTPTAAGAQPTSDGSPASPTAAPSSTVAAATPEVTGPHWEPISEFRNHGATLVGFDDGYVLFDGTARVSFSSDGVEWQTTRLVLPEQVCDYGYASFEQVASSSGAVIAVGSQSDADCNRQPYAWISSDGLTWTRSEPMGASQEETEMAPTMDVWAVRGGWEAATSSLVDRFDETDIVASADGLSWSGAATVTGFASPDGAATGHGRRVLSLNDLTGDLSSPNAYLSMFTSDDGQGWQDLALPPYTIDGPVLVELQAPEFSLESWVLTMNETTGGSSVPPGYSPRFEPEIWLSRNLKSWHRMASPDGRVLATVKPTSLGTIVRTCESVLERDGCRDYLGNATNTEWKPIEPRLRISLRATASGPAGVIALGPNGRVFRLVE